MRLTLLWISFQVCITISELGAEYLGVELGSPPAGMRYFLAFVLMFAIAGDFADLIRALKEYKQ